MSVNKLLRTQHREIPQNIPHINAAARNCANFNNICPLRNQQQRLQSTRVKYAGTDVTIISSVNVVANITLLRTWTSSLRHSHDCNKWVLQIVIRDSHTCLRMKWQWIGQALEYFWSVNSSLSWYWQTVVILLCGARSNIDGLSTLVRQCFERAANDDLLCYTVSHLVLACATWVLRTTPVRKLGSPQCFWNCDNVTLGADMFEKMIFYEREQVQLSHHIIHVFVCTTNI